MKKINDNRRRAGYLLLIAWAALEMVAGITLALEATPVSPSELNIRERELSLKSQEFELKKQESAFMQSIEKSKARGNIISVVLAALALGIPVWIAAINIRAQRKLADEQAKVEFQMKVAELALTNSENATQAREKARALATLFDRTPLLPRGFADRFDPKQFRLDYGHSNKTREKMIELLAQYPGQREQILSDWYVLFRWDWLWVDPLLSVDSEAKKRLNELKKRLEDNEKEVNKPKS
jgi:hypothetical protein